MIALFGTLALSLSVLVSGLVFEDTARRLATALTHLLVSASLGSLLSLVTPMSSSIGTIFVQAVSLPLIWWIFRRSQISIFGGLPKAGLYIGAAVLIQLVTRAFGIGSVAFTDGQTIAVMAQSIQMGEPVALEGAQALKRGFGLASLHTLGNPPEIFVGLMPLFFIGALSATWWLIRSISPSRLVAGVAFGFIAALSLLTEAIARHVYLLNTHSLTWLLVACFLALAIKLRQEGFTKSEWFLVFLLFTSIGFARVDYLILFAPFTLFFMLAGFRQSKFNGFMIPTAQGMAAGMWTSLQVQDFPVFGAAGPLLLVLIPLAGAALLWVASEKISKKTIEPWILEKRSTAYIALLVLVWVLINSDYAQTANDFIINTFVGEGLWGVTAYALVLISIASFLIGTKQNLLWRSKLFLNLGLLTAVAFIVTKYFDGVLVGREMPALVRIGFGDTLNRTLVMFLPFFVLPLSKILAALQSRFTTESK